MRVHVSTAQRCAPNCRPATRTARLHSLRSPTVGPRARRAFTTWHCSGRLRASAGFASAGSHGAYERLTRVAREAPGRAQHAALLNAPRSRPAQLTALCFAWVTRAGSLKCAVRRLTLWFHRSQLLPGCAPAVRPACRRGRWRRRPQSAEFHTCAAKSLPPEQCSRALVSVRCWARLAGRFL